MLLEVSSLAGLISVGVSIVAYLPQIFHLLREPCSAGVSRMAFALLLASFILGTFHAQVIKNGACIVLGLMQIITSLLIFIFSTKYCDSAGEPHALAAREHAPIRENAPSEHEAV
jgi:uncharacterized protein with PQ loop repeat